MLKPLSEKHLMNSLHSDACIRQQLDAGISDLLRDCHAAVFPEIILYSGSICFGFIPDIQHSLKSFVSKESQNSTTFWICPLNQYPPPDGCCPSEFKDPAIRTDWLECLWAWSGKIGSAGAFFIIDTDIAGAALAGGLSAFLLAAAAVGLFLGSSPRQVILDSDHNASLCMGWFVKKPYRIRPARITDLPGLQRLEHVCWQPHLRATPSEIHRRIDHFPSGQCVLIHDERLVAAVYSQRIDATDMLTTVTSHTALSLFSPSGRILQLLAINVMPEPPCQGLGDELLFFMLAYSYAMNGVDRVVAVSLCKNYMPDSGISIQQYVASKNEMGHCIDPILHFHECHGGRISQVIANYRPDDRINQGYGVLVDYGNHALFSKDTRPIRKTEVALNHSPEPVGLPASDFPRRSSVIEPDTIHRVKACLMPLLASPAVYRPDRPLRDMGLDSLKLMELGSVLSHRFGVSIEPGFFFEYITARDIAAFFTNRLSGLADKSHRSPAVLSRTDDDGIAVVGMACRFPDPAEDQDHDSPGGIAAFWDVLVNGRNAVRRLSRNRLALMDNPDPERIPPGLQYGGQIPWMDAFDASFFDISPREARCMDPQQRVLMETTWEALEQAAIDPGKLAGTRCGVFVGVFGRDYAGLQTRRQSPDDLDAYFGTGTSPAVASGRISYFLGLHGPSLTIDTACSSSLVAIHQACESIRSGEVDLAIAGGVNIILAMDAGMAFYRAGMLSVDGCCRTFDAGANGYVRSDGCGVIVLKRLSRAVSDGDPIQAVIRASVINQDGFSNGLTAPSLGAQKMLIREALTRSRLAPGDVQYLEAHGTGTPLGDAVEIQAIAAGYGRDNIGDSPLILGSVKTNIGHCEAAAGVAGLIKVILSLQHEVIPPHLHFQQLGPMINLDGIPAVIARDTLPWTRNPDGPVRYGAVSSFGFSGTNGHVIIQEAPAITLSEHPETASKPCLLSLSAKTPAALSALIRRYTVFLKAAPETDIADLCHTTHVGRAHFSDRAAFVGSSTADLIRLLEAAESCAAVAPGLTDRAREKEMPKIAFLFTGPGSEYPGMGRGLYLSEPVFRQHLDVCEQILHRTDSSGLIKKLLSSASPSQFAAPGAAALFCLQYALTRLWMSWGITPAVVMGHSIGEYAAACAAGVFSPEDALHLTVSLDRSAARCPTGAMVSVLAAPDRVQPLLEQQAGRVVIAACNSPRNTLIAGPEDCVGRVCAALNRRDIQTLRISTACAYHSPLMEPVVTEWKKTAEHIAYAAPRIPVISTLTGCLENEGMAGLPYWIEHIRGKVNFSDGLQTLNSLGDFVFLEIGPQPTILSLAKQNLPAVKTHWLPSLRQGMDDRRQMLTSLGRLYEMGADIQWEALDSGLSCRRISLPTYPFQRQRYWFDASPMTVRYAMPLEAPINSDAGIHEGRTNITVPDHLLYEMSWEDFGQIAPVTCPESSWLILADRAGVGLQLSRRLAAAGRPSIVIDIETFVPAGGIRDDALPAWSQTLQQGIIDCIGSRKLTHVIYLWAMDAPLPDRLNPESLQASMILTVFAVPQILGAMSCIPQDSHARLWLVTCGAMTVDLLQDDPAVANNARLSRIACPAPAVSQAPLWGIGRTAALEYPHLWGGLIDLDPATGSPDMLQSRANALLSAIFQGGVEDQMAIRENRMVAARLKSTLDRPNRKINGNDPVLFYPDASYLITGGLGALGLQTARWMIGNGARHLALISRREPSATILDEIQQMRQSGVNLYIGAADVADMAAMSGILAHIAANMPPLKGVVHAAGVLKESLLAEMDFQKSWSVLSPKIQGAWALHHLTQSCQLDFIVYYSSIAAVWGAKAQGAYAAANQFLDAMAHYHRAAGQTALSVNWGPWLGDGMAGQDSRSWLKRRGLTAIDPRDSFSALSWLLKTDAVQITVADVDWPLFRRIYESWGKHPLFDLLDRGEQGVDIRGQGLMRRQWMEVAESDRRVFLVTYLQAQTARVMGMTPDSVSLNPDQGFFSLGLDSIMAVELRQWISRDLDIDLPMTALFDFPSMTKLAVYIEEMLMDVAEASSLAPVDVAQSANHASELPLEIADLLNKELLELENLLRS